MVTNKYIVKYCRHILHCSVVLGRPWLLIRWYASAKILKNAETINSLLIGSSSAIILGRIVPVSLWLLKIIRSWCNTLQVSLEKASYFFTVIFNKIWSSLTKHISNLTWISDRHFCQNNSCWKVYRLSRSDSVSWCIVTAQFQPNTELVWVYKFTFFLSKTLTSNFFCFSLLKTDV